MLSYRRQRTLLQILPFGVIPAVFSLALSLIEQGILGDYPVYPSTGNPYEARLAIVPFFTSLFVGLTVGTFEVLYVNRWFQQRRFTEKILFKSVMYTFSIIAATIVIVILRHSLSLNVGPLDKQVGHFLVVFLSNFAFWSIMAFFSLSIVVSVFYSEMSAYVGQGVLANLFTGRYHQPVEEERIYLFLDMRSSTTFAEQLGHVRYFQMLKAYYVDLSDAIVRYGGEVYQYVGDEVVITWKFQSGRADSALRCFFAMQQALGARADQYAATYGVVPTFKAGVHYGRVTTGEIGVLKKDIAFSGDVLNTTARIQGLCNAYGVDLLVSEKFADALTDRDTFRPVPLGEVALKGRNEKVHLFTVTLERPLG